MTDFADRPTAVYRFYDTAGRLLYVGITCTLGTRFRAHERTSNWWADQRSVTIAWRNTREGAAAEERAAIREEQPLHNVAGAGAPRIRVRATRPDPALREAGAAEVRVKTAARLLDLSERMMWTLVRRGEIDSIKIGTARRVTRQAILDYISRQASAA